MANFKHDQEMTVKCEIEDVLTNPWDRVGGVWGGWELLERSDMALRCRVCITNASR